MGLYLAKAWHVCCWGPGVTMVRVAKKCTTGQSRNVIIERAILSCRGRQSRVSHVIMGRSDSSPHASDREMSTTLSQSRFSHSTSLLLAVILGDCEQELLAGPVLQPLDPLPVILQTCVENVISYYSLISVLHRL
jgi:hypothetical protein